MPTETHTLPKRAEAMTAAAPQPYILLWRHDGKPFGVVLVGPFEDYAASVRWAENEAHNPEDNPCWHTIELAAPGLTVMTPDDASAAFADGRMV